MSMSSKRPRPGQADLERFLKDEVARRYGSPKRFFDRASFDKTTFYRVMQDSRGIGEASYRRLEGVLDLPRGLLDFIAERKPSDMGTQFEREIWEIYLLPLNDEQRDQWLEAIRQKYVAGDYRESTG